MEHKMAANILQDKTERTNHPKPQFKTHNQQEHILITHSYISNRKKAPNATIAMSISQFSTF